MLFKRRNKVKTEKEQAIYQSMVYGAEPLNKKVKTINFHQRTLKNRLSFNHFKTNNA